MSCHFLTIIIDSYWLIFLFITGLYQMLRPFSETLFLILLTLLHVNQEKTLSQSFPTSSIGENNTPTVFKKFKIKATVQALMPWQLSQWSLTASVNNQSVKSSSPPKKSSIVIRAVMAVKAATSIESSTGVRERALSPKSAIHMPVLNKNAMLKITYLAMSAELTINSIKLSITVSLRMRLE